MANRHSLVLKIIEATALAVLLLLLAFWIVNSEHPLFSLIHADPEKLHQWYPSFGWLIPYWSHIILPLGIGSWTLALTTRERISSRWIVVAMGMILQLTIIQFCSLQAALFTYLIWVIVGYSRAFLANTIHQIVESSRNEKTRSGAMFSWLRSESNLPQARRVFFFAVAIGVLLRVCLVFVTDNTLLEDTSSRFWFSHILAKCYWPDYNILWSINPSVDWLPLHFYMNAALMSIGAKLVHIRLLHAVIGVSCAAILYRIARQLGSREAAMGATAGYLFYPASMIVSTQTLSEPLFLFTVLLSLYYFLQFYLHRTYSHLIMSVIGLFLGTLLRYEGWALLIVFPMIYILFIRPYKTREFLTLFLPVVGPLLIAIALILQGFHPLRGIIYSDYEVGMKFANYNQPIINLFTEGYIEGWIPFSLFSLFALMVIGWGDKKIMVFVCFLVLFMASFVYKNFTLTISPQSRYLILYMTPLLITLSMVLWKGVRKMFGSNPVSFITHLTCVVLLSTSGAWAGSMSLPSAPKGFFESVAFVNKLNEGQFVVSEQPDGAELLWLVKSDLPIDLDFQSGHISKIVDFYSVRHSNDNKSRKCVFLEQSDFIEFSVEELDCAITRNSNIYLVLHDEAELDEYFQFRKLIEHYKGHTFYREFENGGYRIYRKQQ